MYPQLILTVSNLIGIIPLMVATNPIDQIVISAVMFASMLMHVSELKHYYTDSLYEEWSDVYLWIDRVVAVVAALWFLPQLIAHRYGLGILWWFLLGLVFSIYGELRTRSWFHNYVMYPACHTVWHVIVYGCMLVIVAPVRPGLDD